jgi:CheY-like chemotaxis protein
VQRILVVDDNASVREALVALFEGEGYEARGALDGFEALRLLRDGFRASLVVLDMLMPEMDGWDFRRAQRRDPALADIPVVVVTSVVNPTLEAQKLHALAGFKKPLDVYALLEVVADNCTLRLGRRSRHGARARHRG